MVAEPNASGFLDFLKNQGAVEVRPASAVNDGGRRVERFDIHVDKRFVGTYAQGHEDGGERPVMRRYDGVVPGYSWSVRKEPDGTHVRNKLTLHYSERGGRLDGHAEVPFP